MNKNSELSTKMRFISHELDNARFDIDHVEKFQPLLNQISFSSRAPALA